LSTKANHAKLQNARRDARPTIGLLIDNTWDPIAWDVWAGVDDAARKQDANLLAGRCAHASSILPKPTCSTAW